MAADVKQEALVVDGAADAADVGRILLDDVHAATGLGELVGGGEAGRACADHDGIEGLQPEHSRGIGLAGRVS